MMRFRQRSVPAPILILPTLTDRQARVLTTAHEACPCHGTLTRATHMAAIYQAARVRLAIFDAHQGAR
jgi:hypothetical protein